jgi:hypothetical protein
MIIVRIFSGLGNQLFHYALGRALAERHQTTLKLDLASLGYDKQPAYGLRHFNIQAQPASLLEVAPFCWNPRWGTVRRGLRKVLRELFFRRWHIARHLQMPFDPQVFETRLPVYVVGYWQSEKYFAGVARQVREELTLRSPLSTGAQAMLREIRAGPGIGLHVRRTDYVTAANLKLYGACSPGYYAAAIEHIRARQRAPRLFVFSDDIAWVKENLPLPGPVTYRDERGLGDYEDLYLLSQCTHQVIANSTFSWWAAWLNPNPDKLVVGPRPWFRDPSYNSEDIIPQGWVQLPVDA